MRILELGPGIRPHLSDKDEIIHLDKAPLPHVEVVMDLNRLSPLFGGQKLPFPDESFDTILAIDIIEHVIDVVALMEELHRVLKPGGKLEIRTTNWKTANSFRDPTHYHYFTLESMDYFDPEKPLFKTYGHISKARFKVKEAREDGQEIIFQLEKQPASH